MYLHKPIRSVIPGVQGLVLGVLANTTAPLTGRAITGLLAGDATTSGVSTALGRLAAEGLVTCEPAGRANLYALNRNHVAAPAVEALADLRGELLRRISTAMAAWSQPAIAAWMFGSAARGEGTSASDIDILLVCPTEVDHDDVWITQTIGLAAQIQSWAGNSCEILEYTAEDLAALVAGDDPLVDSLRADAIELMGASPRSLLRPVVAK